MTEDEKMEAAYEEAHRRVEEIQPMVGFADDIAAWWAAGFASGALWAQSQPAAPITEAQVREAKRAYKETWINTTDDPMRAALESLNEDELDGEAS